MGSRLNNDQFSSLSEITFLVHITSILTAFIFSFFVLFSKKGTKAHKILGWIFVRAMFTSSISSFWIKTSGHFSIIHILSVFTIYWLLKAILVARTKPKNWLYIHATNMASAYIGILIAGTGVIMRHFIMPFDNQAWIIASLVMSAITIPIMLKLTQKYKT